jgi:hypothetical protein
VVMGDNRALPEFLREVCEALPAGSSIQVIAPGAPDTLRNLAARCSRAKLQALDADPTQIAREPPQSVMDADAVVILGSAAQRDTDADAAALETLVWLRHFERVSGARVRRIVTELRNLSSAMHVTATADDFLVSTEVLGLLMCQVILTPGLHAVLYDDLLTPGANDVYVRARSLYLQGQDGAFGEVMQAARGRGEIAIGLYFPSRDLAPLDLRALLEGRAEQVASSPVWLAPPRGVRVPDDAQVVVLARSSG